jgi:hypothetical protein
MACKRPRNTDEFSCVESVEEVDTYNFQQNFSQAEGIELSGDECIPMIFTSLVCYC